MAFLPATAANAKRERSTMTANPSTGSSLQAALSSRSKSPMVYAAHPALWTSGALGQVQRVTIIRAALFVLLTVWNTRPVSRSYSSHAPTSNLCSNSRIWTLQATQAMVSKLASIATEARTQDTNKLREHTTLLVQPHGKMIHPALSSDDKSDRGLSHPRLTT
ncbi:hypothetical protein C8F01DRAFT_195950 [Mycena amicta]|nr:hypothetical protein C8F01DRAFT_195950 [Mycena amicta]